MTDLINRKDALEALKNEYNCRREGDGLKLAWIEKALNEVPDANTHGEWSEVYDDTAPPFLKKQYHCSACGDWNTYGKSAFCPKCGAMMDNGRS